ncbi:MupA/Atu3671 family FMN-dependent luciferase-like monooxygenase [Streptomyces sp. NPDC021020]|uniref:MupA/Atu3671 family FMN-dependent luciferase-like monooxygenase n=1 Tax=Streptomyces sp. NPDC021020 TaxID=3365109 RepID=UPI0037AFDF36
MRVVELLARLRTAGVEVWADGDLLRFSAPPGALTPELRAALGEHKQEVLEILRRGADPAREDRPLAPVPHDGPLPVSLQQRRMWFFEQVHPGTATYHMSARWRIAGPLDTAALARCLGEVARRHGTLRTAFRLDGGEPVQQVQAAVELPLPVTDLTGLPEAEREERAACLVAEDVARPFDLGRPPLLRALLLRTGAEEWTLALTVHHIIADMWSVDVLLKEIAALYPGGAGTSGLPALPVQYADFAVWQRARLESGELHAQVERRTAALAGAPTLLDLPTDRPRPGTATYAGGQVTLDVPADLVDAVDALCREEGATRFMAMLAAFHVLLGRYCGESDTLVGVPTANRTRLETENLIGFFVNTLVMRGDTADDPTVREFLRRVRDGALEAYEHQETPVESLVESLHPRRDPARSPLFQAMFTVQNTSMAPLRLAGLDVRPVRSDRVATEFDLTLEFTDPREPAAEPGAPSGLGGPSVSVLYNADVFTADSMTRLLGHWRTLLEGMTAGPGRRVGELPLLDGAESELVLHGWNATEDTSPRRPVHEEIAARAAAHPGAVALAFRDRELSYGDLAADSAALAERLRAAGAGAGRLVAVCVERSPEMVAALLGVLRSGAGYLPLDPSMPPERLAYVMDDAGVSAVVTTRAHRALFAGRPVPLVLADAPDEPALGGDGPGAGGSSGEPGLAYAIYTSGSTGRPKGVLVGHGELANFMAAMDGVLGDREDGVWLALTSVSFDIAALELLWPLRRGWKVVVQGDGELLPGAEHRPLDVGLMYFAVSSEEGSPADRYRLLLDGARFADTHGFSAVWTPERHFDRFGGLYPNPAVTAAALAMVTERVALRAGSVVLPLQNPLRVAEEWAVVDNLSGGRAGIAFASGWHADDFALAAGPEVYERRKEVMREGIDTVRRLWRGESVTAVNGVGRETELLTYPRPLTDAPAVWLAAAGSPETFRLAGELGAGVLTHLLGQELADVAEKTAVYRAAWREAGHPGEGHVTLMAHTFVGTDPDEVRERVRGPFREYLRRSFGLIRALAPSLGIEGEPTPDDVEALLDVGFAHYYDGGALIGTVDECVAMAGRITAAGVDELACLIDFGVPTAEVLASLPLLDEVRRRVSADAGADHGIAAQIRRHGVTHVQCTPTLAGVLLADPRTRGALAEVDTFLVGGEALTGALAADLAGTVRGRVLNMYGPTETTIWSSVWQVAAGADVTIGDPVANTSLYVLDAHLRPVPLGVPGELWIGGHGVARGYLGRPELTAERFVPSPFVPGDRLYRTGDRVRRRADGALEFLGRMDRQVKLGGHRIEPGEIEAGLAGYEGVRQAAVAVREDGAGRRALAGYLVADGPRPSAADLRAHLLRSMPAVMVPATFVWLDELPLNPNGKVDHRRLPDPADVDTARRERTAAGTRGPLTDPTEQVIAGIWQDVLDVDAVGPDDDFFELGGHSLMAIQMVSRLREALGGDISLRTVFEAGTVAELARRARRAGPAQDDGIPPLVRRPRPQDPVPLSFAQQRMWFFELMNPGVSSYHLAAALRLRGALEPDHLRRAFEEVVRRHEILRTNFDEADGTPVQLVAGHREVPLPVVDFAGRDDAALVAAAREEARRPFDLARDPLLRTTLLRLSPTEHVLLLTTHHIVADSWSIGVMAGELGALYDAYRTDGTPRLPELPVQYADFTLWQQEWLAGGVVRRQLEFWREALEGAPPLLTLPYDRPRPQIPGHRGEQLVFRLPRETSDGVAALSSDSGATVFIILLAAFAVLLHRWSEHERIVLGVPVGGRTRPELEPMIGFFANITALNIDLTGEPSFTEVLRRVRERVVSSYDHQDLPVEKLVAELGVERTLAYNPLFQVMFVYTNDLALSPSFGGLEVSPVEAHPGHVFMDLNMAMEDGPDGLQGTLDYSSELFDASTVAWLLDSFRVLLDAAVAAPDSPAGGLPLAAPPERADAGARQDDTLPVVVAATFTAGPLAPSLAYWAEHTGLPIALDLAPYDQVFQQLLTPGSAMDRNTGGVNVVLLRPEDWGADAVQRAEVGQEFTQAVKAFQSERPSPLVAVLCPAADLGGTAQWRRALGAGLAQIEDVVCLDMAELLALYDVGDYHDPVSEATGNIPYTQEFFAALGTVLARQLSALTTEAPGVVVLDGDALAAAPEEVRRALADVGETLAGQGRRLEVLRTGGRPPAEALADVLADVLAGVEDGDWLFVSGDPVTCEAVRSARPDALVVECPAEPAELGRLLGHVWEFDAPGQPVPGAAWWEGRRG